jgi:hypothetical protein
MRFTKTLLVAGLVTSMFWVGQTTAQIRKSGITGAAFLKIPVGARASALGSAYTTIPEDVNQIFWNPAGIATQGGKTQLTFSYNDWIAGLAHVAAAVSHDFGDYGTFGAGFVSLNMGSITADRDVVPSFLSGTFTPFDTNTSATYDYNDTAVNLSWAYVFTDKLSMGSTIKYINQSIDGESANAYAFDFGAIYHIGYRGARIGARINNLGSDIKFFDLGSPLPLSFSIGMAFDVVPETPQGMKFTLLADATKPQDGEQLLFSAAEVQVTKYLQIRGGYKFNYAGIDDNKRDEVTGVSFAAPRTEEGATLGAGVLVPWQRYRLSVDYAWTEFGILDNVHRVSFNVGF